jgi:hypothetical protein
MLNTAMAAAACRYLPFDPSSHSGATTTYNVANLTACLDICADDTCAFATYDYANQSCITLTPVTAVNSG